MTNKFYCKKCNKYFDIVDYKGFDIKCRCGRNLKKVDAFNNGKIKLEITEKENDRIERDIIRELGGNSYDKNLEDLINIKRTTGDMRNTVCLHYNGYGDMIANIIVGGGENNYLYSIGIDITNTQIHNNNIPINIGIFVDDSTAINLNMTKKTLELKKEIESIIKTLNNYKIKNKQSIIMEEIHEKLILGNFGKIYKFNYRQNLGAVLIDACNIYNEQRILSIRVGERGGTNVEIPLELLNIINHFKNIYIKMIKKALIIYRENELESVINKLIQIIYTYKIYTNSSKYSLIKDIKSRECVNDLNKLTKNKGLLYSYKPICDTQSVFKKYRSNESMYSLNIQGEKIGLSIPIGQTIEEDTIFNTEVIPRSGIVMGR